MADIYTHYVFGTDVIRFVSAKASAQIDRSLFDLALNGPDDWTTYRFWCPAFRNGKNRRAEYMHYFKTGEFLTEFALETRNSECRKEMFSYLAGYLCHYCLDRKTHPYVNSRAGINDDTPETEMFRGRHLMLEHSIDLRLMKERGLTVKDRPITKGLFKLMRLPPCMKNAINSVYGRVFGWKNAFADLNRARRDMRFFYWIAEDPKGLLYRLLYPVRKRYPGYFASSYYKDALENRDSENKGHSLWHNPHDESLRSDASFEELMHEAGEDALDMIETAYEFVFEGTVPESGLKQVIGNTSYVTGFDLDDIRNKAAPSFCLI